MREREITMPISREELMELKPVTAEDDERLIKEERLNYAKQYREKHKKEIATYMKKYGHGEKRKKYREENKKVKKEYDRTHRRKILTLGAFGEEGFSIRLTQPISRDGKVYGTGFFQGIQSPEQNRFNTLKRKIKNATILNEPFENCVGHHMAKDVVIFIPKEMHQSVWHNLETGEGMDEINGKALVWAGRQSNG